MPPVNRLWTKEIFHLDSLCPSHSGKLAWYEMRKTGENESENGVENNPKTPQN